jgi:hypothetical protein
MIDLHVFVHRLEEKREKKSKNNITNVLVPQTYSLKKRRREKGM